MVQEVHFLGLKGPIADVAVTKRHQRLHEIMLILTALHSKVVFKKAVMMQYTVRLRHLTQSSSHSIRLRACYKCVRFTKHTLI